MMTSFARTGGGDFPLKLKAMISGPPKSGKTTLLGTVPNIVIADTEPHANNLMSLAHLNVPYKTITSSTDLKDLLMVLSNPSLRKQAAEALGMPDIEAVAIDTLDTLQGLLKRERLADNRATTFLRDDWGWLKSEMENILQSFLSLDMHVFLIVHTKTKDVGTEKNPRSVILPGLEGAIAESVAGMVGYSLLSFRKQEIDANGVPFTKYWLRAEGDETYEFLGNRAAGQLPDVIEPHFGHLLEAAKAALAAAQAHQSQVVQVQQQAAPQEPAAGIQTTSQTAPPNQVPQNVGQTSPQPDAAPPKPASDEPITAAALQHLDKMFQTVGAVFESTKFNGWTVGQARELVAVYQAIQRDHAEGKGQGDSPQAQMVEYLQVNGLIGATAPPPENKIVDAKPDGTIQEIEAWITLQGDSLEAVQHVYDLETAKGEKARDSLVQKLISKGAKVSTHVETSAPAEQAPEAPVELPEQAVSPEAPVADVPPTEEEAQANIEAAMGPVEELSHEINPDAPCEACGNKIDDTDIALLSKQRFGKILCVNDYLVETKK